MAQARIGIHYETNRYANVASKANLSGLLALAGVGHRDARRREGPMRGQGRAGVSRKAMRNAK